MAWVLNIEDSEYDLALRRRIFEKEAPGVGFEAAPTGELGLQRLHSAAGSRLPECLFLDLRLPGMGGLEVLRSIRATASLAALPVIVWTGSSLQADRDAAMAAGADEVFVKPDSLAGLIQQSRSIVDRWLVGSVRGASR